MEIAVVIFAGIAVIFVVGYIIYSIDQGNRMRPPEFLRQFTLRPRNGCAGTMATIDWQTINDYSRTLTRRTSSGESRIFVSPEGPMMERVDETTTYIFEATKEGHPPITGTGTLTIFGNGSRHTIDGRAQCRELQTGTGIIEVWQIDESFVPSDWHEGLRVRSATLIMTSPEHRRSLFVVHDGNFEGATQLTDVTPTATFNDPAPTVAGNWLLYVPRMVEERCNENDTRPGTQPYQPVFLGITMTFAC